MRGARGTCSALPQAADQTSPAPSRRTKDSATLAATASALYAKNLFAFVETMFDKEKKFAPTYDDELIKATLLTKDGAVVHPNFKKG